MIREGLYRKLGNLYKGDSELALTEIKRLENDKLIDISKEFNENRVEELISIEKLSSLLSRDNYKIALLNTLGSIVYICNIASSLGIPILGDELLYIGKKVVKGEKTIKDYKTIGEYMVYLRNDIDVEDILVDSEIDTYIYEGIGAILLLNLISEKITVKIEPNFINILKNIGMTVEEVLEVIKIFSKKQIVADLDPLFDGTLSHDERIKTIETLKDALMVTFLGMSTIGAYDKIDEMRDENNIFKKLIISN